MAGQRYQVVNKVQYNEYYPFGLQTANSWTRENTTGNNFLGNGGTELNTISNFYDLDYSQYDPVLGRLNGIDPMATKYASLSPYNFSFNDPVTYNDPNGADPYQRSDDTWWVASRESLAGGRYTGYSSLNDFLRENRPSGVLAMDDPWAWTGMSSGEMYGEGIGRFGAGYLPGEFLGTAQDKEEIWIDYFVKENGNYIDSEFKGYRYTDRKRNRDVKYNRNNPDDPRGDKYIERYEKMNAGAFARLLVGTILLENGVGGDMIAVAREIALTLFDPNDETKRFNEMMSTVKLLVSEIKSVLPPQSKAIAEVKITVIGLSYLAQAEGMFVINEFFNVPRIRQFAPTYYQMHIEGSGTHHGSGNGGNSHKWDTRDW